MPLVKQRGFKFSILCDVFLLNIIIILLSIQINVAYSVPTTKTTIKATIEPTTTLSIIKNTTSPTTVVVAAVAATSSIVGTTTSPPLSSLWPIITSTSSPLTTKTKTTRTAAVATATTSIKVEKFNLSVQLQQHNYNNNNYNLTKSNKDNNHNNNVSSSSNSSRNNNNNDNDKILIKKNYKNFNSSVNDNNNYNNNGDNNNNNNQNKTKELPIQYAELETLKTLSKRFDIYSDFSKIPFDTIHRILRDEEPEYRMDGQRIQRRWKKSTSTEGTTNHNQQKYSYPYHSYNTKYYHHSIEKRSPKATTTTMRNDQPLQESSYDDDVDDEDNYDKYNNNNNNKNINNIIIEANNLDDENINTSNSSNDSTKTKIFLNLENKNFTTLDTIIKQLNRIDNNNNITNNRIEYINLKNNNLNIFPLNYLNKFINLKYLDLSNNRLKQFHLINNNNLNNNHNNSKDNGITFQLEILNLSGNQISNLTFDDILPSTITPLITNSSSEITSKILETIGNDNKLITSNPLSKYFNKLKELNLSRNSIKSLQSIKNVTMLKNLERINLSCNQIDKIDKEFFYDEQQQQQQENKLKYLNLSNNKLNGVLIKDTFQNLINMITLDLSSNHIAKIDLETFQLLPNLQYLDLSYNNIDGDSIHSLQGIPDLIGLSIAYNPNLGDSLQEFVASWSLKELDISGTGLCKIPAALAQSVRSLKLANNWFEIIRCGDLDSYPLLQYLDLSYSHINDIEDDALGRLEILETLFLDHNNLYRIPISLPISLENLFLHNNQIMDIQSQTFQNLINLKILDLSENKIMYLPELPLPKLLTLNLQSCELKGLSQSVVKTSPKIRDLLLDGNPIKCTDLLGIAEWASPCRNEKYIEPITNIKTNIQNIHIYFNHFNHNNEQDNKKLCDVNNGNDDCCGNSKMKEVKKPICANVYRNQQNTNILNQVNEKIKESQLQKNNDTNSNNDDDNNNNNDNDNNNDDSLKLSASFDPVRMNRFEKDMKRTKQENYRNQKKDKIIDKFSTLEQTSNKAINSKSEVKVYDNQSRSLFMTNTTTAIGTPTTNNSGKMNITTSLFLKTETTKKDTAALQNEHETIIKTSKKSFSDTSTNEQVYNDINNQRNRKKIKYSNSNNNTSILVDARIPILSLLYNSNESLIDNVKHQDENEATIIITTTTKATTNTVKEEKISENVQQKQNQKQQQLSEQQQEKRRGTENRIMPNIKSDNNYVETSVLLESMRIQKRKQNESHFESKNENGQQQQKQRHNNNSKELETKKIIEGKNTSKNIETLPKYNDEHFISSHIINDDNIKDGKNATIHGYNNYSADTKLRTIDDGHTDMSVAIKSNQINESKFLMPNKTIQKSEIKESGIILSEAFKDFPINDQSLSDDTNLELKSTTRTIMSQHKSQSNRKLFENNKQKEIIKNHNTKKERKVNFPETKSNFEENNFQNNKRKTIKDTTISTELFSTLPSKYDISKIIQFESPAKIITTQKPPNFKILYTTTASATTTKTTASNTIMSTKQIPVKMPSNRNKADEVVFFDQQSVVKKEGYIVSENRNISHSVGGNYHQTETVNQEAVSTNSNYKSQKQHDHLQHPCHHQQQHQHQHQHEQQKHYQRNLEQQHEKLFGNQRQRQQESKTMSEGLIQKHLKSEITTVFNNNTNRSLLQREAYNPDSQQDETNENINSGTSYKQNAFDNKDIGYSVKTVSDNIVNRMNGKIPNKEATENTTTYLSSNKFREAYQVNDVATTKLNATKLKRPRNKQSRKYGNKNQKVQAINLENSPLIKEKNENLQSGINFLAKSSMKNPTQLPESEIKTMTFGNGKHTLLHHTNLNTPKKLGIHETYFDVKDQKILDTKNENYKTDMSLNADKLTTHSLIHHTVNTAILPYTVDDYAFERSGNKESSNYMSENSLPPTSIELVKLYSPNLDILSSYSNDEPNHQETSNDFEANFKSKYILTTELNRIVPFTDETEQNTLEDAKLIHHTSTHLQNRVSLVAENSSKTTINNTNYTSTNTNTISNTTINHKFTTASNKSNNNNNDSGSNNNVGGGDNDKGLPPEQWLDIRKAKNHPGLFIVIGVTFGMLLTLGVIHIYRCRRPWYYYYNQKVPHTTTLHNNNFPHFNNHHHHHQNQHHHHQQQHHNNNNNTRRQYNDTSHDQYSSRHHSLTTTSSSDYCQCDNDGDYYIAADYESQSSSIRRDFLPMELLSLNGNLNDNNDTNDDICSRINNRRRNNNGINLHQSRKNSKNTANHHLVDGIW